MLIKEVELKFKKGQETAPFVVSSCKHIGSGSQSQEGMDNLAIACGKYPWIDLGDMIEGIMPNDKRFTAVKKEGTFLKEMQGAIDWITPVRKNCWGILPGNHEEVASKAVGDATGFIANNAKVPYLTQTCYLVINTPKGRAVVFVAHGHVSANFKAGEPERRVLNRQIKLRNELQFFDADAIFVGHGHRKIITAPCYEMKLTLESFEETKNPMEVKSRPVLTRPTLYAMSPSMFKTYTFEANYAQACLFPPTATGWLQGNVARDGTIVSIDHFAHTGKIGKTHVPTVVD